MAGFQQEKNYDFLKGAELTQIRVNRHTVDFAFSDDQSINLATEFEHYVAATKVTHRYEIQGNHKDFTVQWLLNLRTDEIVIVSDDALKLTFSNGDSLTVFRVGSKYESMTIWGHPQGVIVIL